MTRQIIADSEDEDDGDSPPQSPTHLPQPQLQGLGSLSTSPSRGTSSTDTAFFKSVYYEQANAAQDRARSAAQVTRNVTGAREQGRTDQDPWDVPSSPDLQSHSGNGRHKRRKLDFAHEESPMQSSKQTGSAMSDMLPPTASIGRGPPTATPGSASQARQDFKDIGDDYPSSVGHDTTTNAQLQGQRTLNLDTASSATELNTPRSEDPLAEGMYTQERHDAGNQPPSSKLKDTTARSARQRRYSSPDEIGVEEPAGPNGILSIDPLAENLFEQEDLGPSGHRSRSNLADAEMTSAPGDHTLAPADGESRIQCNLTSSPEMIPKDGEYIDKRSFHTRQSPVADGDVSPSVKRHKPRGRPRKRKTAIHSSDEDSADDVEGDDGAFEATLSETEKVISNADEEEIRAPPQKLKKARGRPKGSTKPKAEKDDENDGKHEIPTTKTPKKRGRPRKTIPIDDLPVPTTEEEPLKSSKAEGDDEARGDVPRPRPSSPANQGNSKPAQDDNVSEQDARKDGSEDDSPSAVHTPAKAASDILSAKTEPPNGERGVGKTPQTDSGKPLYRVGLSKRTRIAPLLKIIKR